MIILFFFYTEMTSIPISQLYSIMDSLIADTLHSEPEISLSSCPHHHSFVQDENTICSSCGDLLNEAYETEKDWFADSTCRTSLRQVQADKSIIRDISEYKFDDSVITLANNLYTEVTSGDTCRGESRRCIIFACTFYAFQILGNPQTCETLISLFRIKKKVGLKGLKYVNLHAPISSKIRMTFITPEVFVDSIMTKINASAEQKTEVKNMYKLARQSTHKITRSKPQSVAAALIYHWMELNNKKITLPEFCVIANLSETTVKKVLKIIKGGGS